MNTFNIFFLLIALALIVSILLQQRGAGLGEAFGGTGGVYSSRRGAERALYNLTVLLSILFILFGGISVYQRRVKVPKPNEQVLEQATTATDAAATPATSTPDGSTNSPATTPNPQP
ncbi:MAG: preprotein translocase subunit SecG [bacterium]|nr:preprotein translocase subunit SecG [bacterium]